MKCKKCGTPVKAGDVYCPNCGTEIMIVPDFNVFEDDISNAIGREDRSNASRKQQTPEPSHQPEKPKKMDTKKVALLITIGVIVVVAIIFGISVLITHNQNNKSFSYQYDRAQEYLNNELPDKALEAIHKALAINANDEKGLLLLAEIQIALGKDAEAINTLLSVVDLYPDNFEAYNMLIDLYDEKGDYESIAKLSYGVKDERILALFVGYVPKAPSFVSQPGTYEDFLMLELQSDANSQIYYTLDGSSPIDNGKVYTEEIELEVGKTKVRAAATNEYGIYSEIVEGDFIIEMTIPDKPSVSLPSGTYDTPQMIIVTVPEGCNAYYTWDGTTPNAGSTRYTKPFELIKGNNVLSVIIINANNQSSDVARFLYFYYPEEEETVDDDN